MRTLRAGATAALVLVACFAETSRAEDAKKDSPSTITIDAAKNADLFSFNYGLGASPALSLLGLSPSKAQVTSKFKPFALSVPTLFTGAASQGVGIDFAPAWALNGLSPIYRDKYEKAGFLRQAWYRSSVEVALTTGASSTDPTKIQQSGMAVGITTSLLPNSDPNRAIRSAREGTFFDWCVDQLAGDFNGANAEILTKWNQVDRAAQDLDASLQVSLSPATPTAADADDIISRYLALYPNSDRAKDIIAKGLGSATPANITPDRITALAALRDLLMRTARDPSVDAARQTAATNQVAILDGVALATIPGFTDGGLVPPAGATSAAEYAAVAHYIATLSVQSPDARFLQKSIAFAVLQTPAGNDLSTGRLAYVIANREAMHNEVDSQVTSAKKEFNQSIGPAIFMSRGLTKKLDNCKKATATIAAASSDVTIGVGYVEAGDPGKLKGLHSGGVAGWAAIRLPIPFLSDVKTRSIADLAAGKANYTLLAGSLTYTSHASLTTGNATTPIMKANSFGVWGGLEAATSNFREGFQMGYTRSRALDSANAQFNTNGMRWQVSGAVLIGSTLWLGGTYGTANGNTAKLDDKTFLFTIGFSNPPSLPNFSTAKSN